MNSNLIQAKSRGKAGLIDSQGVVVVPFDYDAIHDLFDSARSFLKDRDVGFLGIDGKVLIEKKFSQHFYHVPRFSEGLAAISEGDMFGFIDKAGNWSIQPKWTVTYDMFQGRAIVESEAGYFIINKNGDVLSELDVYKINYQPGWPVDWDRIMCLEFDKDENLMTSFCDSSGNIVFPPTYPDMTEFFEGIAGFSVYDQDLVRRWGLVDEAGEVIKEPGFATLSGFDGVTGLAVASISDKQFGFVDRAGEWVIEPRFRGVSCFSEGLAPVRIGKRVGYMDRSEEIVIEPMFDECYRFVDGLAKVLHQRVWKIIDKSGGFIWEG